MMKIKWPVLFLGIVFFLCNSCGGARFSFSIAMDPAFSPLDLEGKEAYIWGYMKDFLMLLSKQSGKEIQKVKTASQNLFSGLEKEEYIAVISSLPPYPFYQDKYDFSEPLLELGFVLILPYSSRIRSLEKLEEARLGIYAQDKTSLSETILPKGAFFKTYPSYNQVLQALVTGEVEGALLERIPAVNFLSQKFAGRLKIVGKPITSTALRVITLKGKSPSLLRYIHTTLQQKNRLEKLRKKWQL